MSNLRPDLENAPTGQWIPVDAKSMAFQWDIPTKPLQTSIVWRGLPIHLRMEHRSTQFGGTFVTTWWYNNKLYHVKTTKYKWSGGHHGDYPPEISTSTHKLKIGSVSRGILLQDDPIPPHQNLNHPYPFKIITTPADIDFGDPWSTGRKTESRISPPVNKSEVTLYDFNNSSLYVQSNAYFDKDHLVVDRWKLTDNFEYEEYCLVAPTDLNRLFEYFKIQGENKAELLISLHNGFKGREAYANFLKFLDENHIPYSLRRR